MARYNRFNPEAPRIETNIRREEEEEKNSRLKTALGVAAAAGIGYVAYRNLPRIAAWSNVTINRGISSNQKFTGIISDAINLNEVLDETIEYTPSGILKTFRREGNTEYINERLRAKNSVVRNFMDKSFLSDVSEGAASLADRKGQEFQASMDTNLARITKMFKEDNELFENFGERKKDVFNIIANNQSKLTGGRDPIGTDDLNMTVYELMMEYNGNPEKAIDLKLKSNEETRDFMENLITLVNDVSQETSREATQYFSASGKHGSLADNLFGQNYEAIEFAKISAISERSDNRNTFVKGMLDRGFEPVTMGEATKNYVREENGRLFMTADDTAGDALEKFFSNKHSEGNFASEFIDRAANLGMERAEAAKNVFSSELFVNPETSELINAGIPTRMFNASLDSFENSLGIPFLNFNPVRFLPGRKTQDITREGFDVLRGGVDIQPLVKAFDELDTQDLARNLDARSNKLARSYYFVNGKIIDSNITTNVTGDSVAERFRSFQDIRGDYTLSGDYSLGDARSGMTSRYAQAVSGRTNRTDLDDRNALLKFFNLGGQEKHSNIDSVKNYLGKYSDPMYAEHAVENLIEDAQEGRYSDFSKNITNVKHQVYSRTRNLDRDGQDILYDGINEAFKKSDIFVDGEILDITKIHDDDYAIKAMQAIGGRSKTRGPGVPDIEDAREHIRRRIENTANYWGEELKTAPESFLGQVRYTRDDRIFKPARFFHAEETGRDTVSKMDDIRMLIERYGINEASYHDVSLFKGMTKAKEVGFKEASEQLSNLRVINEMDYFESGTRRKRLTQQKEVADYFTQFYKEDSLERINLEASLRSVDSLTSMPLERTERGRNLLGQTQRVAIADAKNPLREMNESLVRAAESKKDGDSSVNIAKNLADSILKDTGNPFAGPNSDYINNITRDIWFFGDRMDSTLQQFGLGLPNKNKGSFWSIVGGQYASIAFGLYATYEAAKYVDGLTGDFFSDTLADTYVNMQLDLAGVKEATGINYLNKRKDAIFPWLKQADDTTPGRIFNFATMNLFSESRNKEELEEYYVSGEDPVRKGRYWGIGSSGAWQGGRISHYEPNWYRQIKSDYMFTEDIYGSEREYWANHWMPTPTNPAAPIRHFFLDPYHYENKHAESRPYVQTGGFDFVRNFPLIGPAADRVVSGVLKPTRINPRFQESHEEMIERENQKIVSSYLGMNAGGTLQIKGSGSVSLKSNTYSVAFSGDSETGLNEDGFVDETALQEDAEEFTMARDRYIASVYNNVTIDNVYMRGGGDSPSSLSGAVITEPSKIEQFKSMFRFGPTKGKVKANSDLREINQRLTDATSRNFNDDVTQAGTLLTPNRIINQEDAINSQAILSPQGVAKDTQYRLTEFGGMYGYLSTFAPGVDDTRSQPVLETSARFNNTADNFWDMNLGGLGGDFSEIFRRYFPRDTNKYYNPIKNTMPDWMPNDNYFIDFQRGDPYSKIPKGEMRLPGSGYESIYSVRKDAYGNYSALDRLRILADVAPYSEEYRIARKEVSLLNQNNMLDEQQKADYAQIREQVTAKNKRKEFYEDRFSEIDVSHETVTIEKVIDQNTFLTKEYGNNPIRFAGVRVKQDDETSMAIINQMLKPGTKVKIALDNNPQTRVRDDIYDTMRAVVYAPESQEGAGLGFQPSYLMRGQNMNLWLSKQEDVTVNDDETDISTLALFDDVEIGIGRLGNFIRRDIIGNTPILNMIADIYLPTDDAVSSYEKEIFSKSWRSWDEPIKGWLQPMFENTASQNPLEAALHGGGIGALASIGNRAKGFWVGAAVFGTIAGVRTVRDTLKGDDSYDIWKPKRREKEFEINEYFDRITYLKYKGLYSRAVELAYEEEGVDLERIFQIQEDQDKGGLEEYLKEKKKWLTIEKKTIEDYKSGRIDKALEEVKQDLESLGNEEILAEVGPYTALALRYKDAYESTLFAAGSGETYDYNKIYRALPYKDRPFFTEFIKAKPRDRQRILELVPDNQRPIYQRFFGMDIEEVQTNEEYFSEYALPHQNWEGWEAGESLDNVKIKVMRNEGVELTESNYWPEDEAIADEYGLDAIEVEQTNLADRINPGRLEKILRGAGLQDVSISFISTESETSNITANLNITNDRTRELDSGLREYLQYNI